MKRADDYQTRRNHLKDLTDEQLKLRFWELSQKIVQPMLDLGYKNTTPSVERSILLRLGFTSLEAKPIVEGVMARGLMSKGCGNVVWRLSIRLNTSVREAGVNLAGGKNWELVDLLFEGGNK